MHHVQFDSAAGRCVLGPKIGLMRLKTGDETVYEVKVEEGSVKVKI